MTNLKYTSPGVGFLDSRYLKLSGSLAEVTNHSHTVLSDIGTNTHAQLDTFKDTTVPATYAPIASPTFTGTITSPISILPIIKPVVDSTTAIGIFKANGTTNIVNVDTTNGRVGIGTTGPGAKLHVVGADFPLATFERTSTATDHFKAVNRLLHTTTADMTTTFGVQQTFSIQDSAGVINDIAAMGAQRDGADNSGKIVFQTANAGTSADKMVIDKTGNVGIGTTVPTNLLSLGGNSVRIFWMERHTTANTAGNTLTVQAGGATVGATDKAGGDLILQPGISTGSAESGAQIKGCIAGVSGTADRTLAVMIQVLGNKLGFFAQTPVGRQTYTAVSNPPTQAEVTVIRDALINLGLMNAS